MTRYARMLFYLLPLFAIVVGRVAAAEPKLDEHLKEFAPYVG